MSPVVCTDRQTCRKGKCCRMGSSAAPLEEETGKMQTCRNACKGHPLELRGMVVSQG